MIMADDPHNEKWDDENAVGGPNELSSVSGSELDYSPSSYSSSPTILPSAYKKILVPVPHDNTETSHKALGHAIYLANATGSEIVILFVVGKIEDISDTTFVGSDRGSEGVEADEERIRDNEGREGQKDVQKITVTAQGEVKKMIEEKLNLCKAAGIKGQVSYRLTTGKSVEDEIANLASTGDIDLIVMTSDTISSSIRSFGSTARKVIDNVEIPVMIIHS
jgi:nucleotide-binding universal stress UspA family protein